MKIGFIGLGNVGSKLSGSLIRNGHDVTVLDLNPDLMAEKVSTDAKAGESAAQLMRECDAVITCLPSPAASNVVMQEMLPEVCEGKVWMEMSTTDQAEAVRLGTRWAQALVSGKAYATLKAASCGGGSLVLRGPHKVDHLDRVPLGNN